MSWQSSLNAAVAALRKEEQRRFEILDAHWDVPLNEVDLDARKPSR